MMLSGSGAMETAFQAESQLGFAISVRTIKLQQEGAAGKLNLHLHAHNYDHWESNKITYADVPLETPLFVLRLSESLMASPSDLMPIVKAGRKGWALGCGLFCPVSRPSS